jgi:hypothetical protein
MVLVKPVICVCCGEELVIGIAEGAVLAHRLVINGIIGRYKGEQEEYCHKKERYPLLRNSGHRGIIQRENFRVKVLLGSETTEQQETRSQHQDEKA